MEFRSISFVKATVAVGALLSLSACKNVREVAEVKCDELFQNSSDESLATCKQSVRAAEQKYNETTAYKCLGIMTCRDPMKSAEALWISQEYCDEEYRANKTQLDVCRRSVEAYMLARVYAEGYDAGYSNR